MTLTFVVALHVAFPILVKILLQALFAGGMLFVFVFLPLYVIVAFTSESKDGFLNVDDNPNSTRLWRVFGVTQILIYVIVFAVFAFSELTGL